MEAAAIVLAAGAGTRMKSKKPKVAHEVLGKPLVRWVVDAAREAGVQRVVSVVGHAREQVEPLVADTQTVVQTEQNGTAGAVAVCKDALADFDGSLVVLSGDCPLITADTIARLAAVREENDAAVVVLTMQLDDPFGYGRIVRDEQGAYRGAEGRHARGGGHLRVQFRVLLLRCAGAVRRARAGGQR